MAILLTALAACDSGAEPAPIIERSSPSQTDSAAPSSVPDRPTLDPTVRGDFATGLAVPWGMSLLPDGSLLVTERDSAEVKRFRDGEVTVIAVIEDAVEAGGEGGLLGIAVPPDFTQEQRVFLYYTSENDNRVVSMSYDGESLSGVEEVLTGIPKANIHNGGRIKFGPDGYLYIATGDAAEAGNAQDQSSLGGKILRVTAQGEPAPGNPFGSVVYSFGHRNVQGLAWDSDDRLWASEFGPDRDDELNLIVPGGNYGWPTVTGAPGNEDFIDAQVVWPSTATSSPSGLAIVDDVAYVGGLRGERLWRIPLSGGAAGEPVSFFDGTYGRLRDTIAGPEGGLFIATNEGDRSRILQVDMQ